MKVRFLRDHCWGEIKEKERSCNAEGIDVQEIVSDSLEVKGTQTGRKDMIIFLAKLAGNVKFKVRISFVQQEAGELGDIVRAL
jgi:hypothetical protein